MSVHIEITREGQTVLSGSVITSVPERARKTLHEYVDNAIDAMMRDEERRTIDAVTTVVDR